MDTSFHHQINIKSLASISYEQISKLRSWLAVQKSSLQSRTLTDKVESKKYKLLEKQFQDYDSLTSYDAQISFLCKNSLGLYCITSLILVDSSTKGYIREVECVCEVISMCLEKLSGLEVER